MKSMNCGSCEATELKAIEVQKRYIETLREFERFDAISKLIKSETVEAELLTYERLLVVRHCELKILIDELGYLPKAFAETLSPHRDSA